MLSEIWPLPGTLICSSSRVALFGPHQRSFRAHAFCGGLFFCLHTPGFLVVCLSEVVGVCACLTRLTTRMESKGGSWFVWCLILPRLHQLGSRHPEILSAPALGMDAMTGTYDAPPVVPRSLGSNPRSPARFCIRAFLYGVY